ncbi:unnamed protein product, partial [Nippostrongylus brasiliensis]|uniref:SCP domain-containing protein n=1 Tax=Nippostrongylus brasiliensis TaxID=27835 RepID=A0A0N4XH91_NIPBR
SYECSPEEVANENVKKCEKQSVNKNSVDTGSNVHIIEDVSVTKEAALERAIGEWFKQLQEYGMDPHSSWTEDPTVKDCANIIYENYTAVGCAVNRCTSRGFTVVECRYGPKRLQYGSLVYEVGAPCSKCKAPQKCVLGSLCQ